MYKVLIADDEPFILDGLKHLIDWEEYNLEIAAQASNGLQALEILKKTHIDILITDIRMPAMDGIELIRNVRQNKLNTKCIVLSGYDDFIYVKEAAKLGIENYLLKSVDIEELIPTLQNTIEKIEGELYYNIQINEGMQILRNNVLFRWVSGDIKEDELFERAKLLDLNIIFKNYTVVVLRPMEINSKTFEDKHILCSSITNICEEITKDSAIEQMFFLGLNGNILLVAVNLSGNAPSESLETALKKISATINLELHEDVFITVGSMEKDVMSVYTSYMHAKNLQDYSLITPTDSIIFYDIFKENLQKKENIAFDFQSFREYILERDIASALKLIDSFFDHTENWKGLTPSYLKNFCLELVMSLSMSLKSAKPNSEFTLDYLENPLETVLQLKSYDEIKNWAKYITESSIEFLSIEYDMMSPVVKSILKYIDINYSKKINLNSISGEFNINANYLGQLFKKETGESFINYLNKIRVERAKKLLINTHMKTAEISELVGFSSSTYFFTVFKKFCCVTPLEYKK